MDNEIKGYLGGLLKAVGLELGSLASQPPPCAPTSEGAASDGSLNHQMDACPATQPTGSRPRAEEAGVSAHVRQAILDAGGAENGRTNR